MRNSFVLYSDYLPQIELLSMEQRGYLLTAVMRYSAGLDIPELDTVTAMAFGFIKSQIDIDKEKYNKAIETRRENGKLGGRPRLKAESDNDADQEKNNGSSEKPKKPDGFSENLSKTEKPNGFLAKSENHVYVDDNVNDNVNNNVVDIDICTEPEPDTVLTIPLNDKSEYPIAQSDIDEWQGLYPAVDVMQQLRSMRGWCNANPARRKTKKGIKRFINTWLAREQDKGGSSRDRPPKNRDVNRSDAPDYDAIAREQALNVLLKEGG